MKKTLTVSRINKSNLSTTLSENINKFKSKIKDMKSNFKKNKI
jgi:hypothetical protein